MQPHFLFIVHSPAPGLSSEDPTAATRWHEFEAKLNAIPKDLWRSSAALERLARNVWLFPFEGAEAILREIQDAALGCRFAHTTYLVPGPLVKH